MIESDNLKMDGLIFVIACMLMAISGLSFIVFERIVLRTLEKISTCPKCKSEMILSLTPGDFGYYCPKCD